MTKTKFIKPPTEPGTVNPFPGAPYVVYQIESKTVNQSQSIIYTEAPDGASHNRATAEALCDRLAAQNPGNAYRVYSTDIQAFLTPPRPSQGTVQTRRTTIQDLANS